ncbi:cation diffusion facilitator family transporter [Mariniluteicoccus endophyticus]
MAVSERQDLSKYAWLSIAAAVLTISLKAGAWAVTGSVGLLSDAAESIVNLVAAVVALVALRVSARPADSKFTYGRAKAEYFSAAIEGMMIFVAAAVILVTSVERFVHPKPLEDVGLGLGISVVASLVNGGVALVLLRAGERHRSLTLTADGRHLMTDVVTSAGVVIGVLMVWLTGWDRLDAIVAFLVGINIIITGSQLVSESLEGLLDVTLPPEENAAIVGVLRRRTSQTINFHGLQTRQAGHQRYASVHVLVPAGWTVQQGHDYVEGLETELRQAVPDLEVLTHLEPLEDPRAYRDRPRGEVRIEDDPTPDRTRTHALGSE